VRAVVALLAGCCIAASAMADPPRDAWSDARRVDVIMVDNRFEPNRLTLRHGVAYVLHLENRGTDLHEFTAPAFFAAARLRDPARLANGGQDVVVQPGASADITLVPEQAGHFDLTCADHDWDGMTGEIVVE